MASVYTQNTYAQCFYTWQAFTHKASFSNREAFTHKEAFTHSKLSHTASVYTQNTYTQCIYTWQAFTHRSFYTQQAFTQRSFYTQQVFTHSKRLHTEHLRTVLLHMASVYTQNTYAQCFYTWQAFTHKASFSNREAFTHREACTHNKLLHAKSFTHSKLSQTASVYTQNTYAQCFYTWQAFTHTETFTQRRFYTQRSFYTQNTYTQQVFTEKVFTQRSFLVHNHNRNCSCKTGSRRQSNKKTILKHFWKGFLKGKLVATKLRKSADKSKSQPWCSHSNTIYEIQLQKTKVLRMQPRHRATLTQPLQCDLQRLSCKTQ